jgi:hypothetical protein
MLLRQDIFSNAVARFFPVGKVDRFRMECYRPCMTDTLRKSSCREGTNGDQLNREDTMAHRTRSRKISSARMKAGITVLLAVMAGAAGCVSAGTERENAEVSDVRGYPIVGTSQTISYDDKGEIAAPAKDEPFYGQDSQHPGNAPAYIDNGDGTITDTVTGLM